MTFSYFAFIEALILKPFYTNYAKACRDSVSRAVDVGDPLPYAVTPIPNGIGYTTSRTTDDHNQYQNNYTVKFVNTGNGVQLQFAGHIYAQKVKTTNMFFCTARAWADGFTDWACTVDIQVGRDANGNPKLSVGSPNPTITNTGHNSGKNDCADILGGILDGIIGVFTLGFSFLFFNNLFHDLLNSSAGTIVAPIGSIDSAAQNVNGSYMLPAGNIFHFDVRLNITGIFFYD
jgi:hypothetical protein